MRKTVFIDAFDFVPGRILARKYEVLEKLGEGWEGEVYLLRELTTGIEKAGKFFYPDRNPSNRALKNYAKKLHRLHHCPIVIQYYSQETIQFRRVPVSFLVSEFVEGELLKDFLARQRGKRLSVFQGLHLLHALAAGMEHVHAVGEYHGDLHSANIIVKRYGLSFELRLFDMFQHASSKRENIRFDVCDMIRIFYDVIGGAKRYAAHPPEVKAICCGLKRSLIWKKYRTAGQLREYLETLHWESS